MKDIINLLNAQYNREMASCHLYLNISSWFADRGLLGWAKLFLGYADEEKIHSETFRKFIIDLGAVPELTGECKVKSFKEDVYAIIIQSLEHEREITSYIQKIKEETATGKIGKVEWFADKFLEEQVEEERKFLNLKNKLDLLGKDGCIISQMDLGFLD